MDADDEADRATEEFVRDRRWLRCASCGYVGDAEDDEDDTEMVVMSEGGRVVTVLCLPCAD